MTAAKRRRPSSCSLVALLVDMAGKALQPSPFIRVSPRRASLTVASKDLTGTIATPMARKLLSHKDMQNTGWLDEHGEIIDPSVWKTEEEGAATYAVLESSRRSLNKYSYIVAAFDDSILDKSPAYLMDCVIDEDKVADYAASDVSRCPEGRVRPQQWSRLTQNGCGV